MIKKYFVLVLFFFLTIGQAQSPEKFTYQSIIKTSTGYLLKNQDVGLRISVLRNSTNGIAVYSEEHFPTSNSNGLVTLIIGEGLTGDNFSDINWGGGEYFLKVEVDPEGGVNYTMNQTSQLLSVPYALYAENAKLNLLGQDFITLQDQTLTINKVDLADDVEGILPVANGGTGSSSSPMVGVITAADEVAARSVLGLGTAAITDSTDYATAAQGLLADSAQQPPIEGAFVDGDKTKLDGIEALADVTDTANVTAAGALMESEITNLAQVKAFDSSVFATAAQGALADTALQDATAFATAAQGALADTALQDATAFATAAQGALADTALQDATAFATAAQGALADTALQDATAFATAAQGALADTALQDATAFATAAQGALADTALQDATAFATAAQGALADTALQDATAFATAAQGALADTALQDATAFATAAQGALADTALQDATAFATAAQGALADTALQDATAFATAAQGALADTALQDATAFATAAQGALADTALQDANNLSDLADAAAARTNLGVDAAGTDNSTDVTLANTNYLTISGQEITGGTVPIGSGGTGATTAANARTALGLEIGTDVQAYDAQLADVAGLAVTNGNIIVGDGSNFVAESGATARASLGVDAAGTDNSTDVTLASVTGNYLTISDQEITAGTVPVALGGTGATTATAARASLGVDAAGTDNSTDVTLANTNYLTISGQEITGGTVPIGSGGTGATTAANARTALGLEIGTDVQAYDAQLADVAGLAVTNGNIIVGDGSNFVAESGATARASLGVDAAGTDNSTDVTLASVTGNYLTISDQEITAGTVPVALGGTGATTATAARASLGVDAAGTDNSTDVTLANTNYLTISGQEITGGTVPIGSGGTGATTAANARTALGLEIGTDVQAYDAQLADVAGLAVTNGNIIVGDGSNFVAESGATARASLGVDAAGTDNSTDVTLASVTGNYLTISDQEITAGTVPVALGGTGATTATAARASLGVDAAGTDNSTDVTLASVTGNYLTISDQEITAGTIPVALGGTGATTAANARTALGLEIGTDVQAYDAQLADVAGLAVTNGNIIVGDGSNFVAESGATARASLGVDAAGTDNSTDVTLANTNYLTISGQEITGGTVPIGSGGTGATTAANARTALGLEIGTDVQAYDAQLADVAGLAVTNGNIIVGDGSNFVAESGATARASLGVDAAGTDNSTDVTLANTNYLTISGQEITGGTVPIGSGGTGATTAANARTALGLEIGTDVQAYDAQLADVAGLAVTNGNIIVGDGSNFVAESGATARASLGVDAAGTDNSTDVTLASVTGNYLTISDQEITAGTVPVALGGTGATTATAARASLGVDAAGTDNSTDVTLANTNYLTISGQEITGGTVPIGSGGTGATTAANARTALGLEIGTDVQAYDAQLADVAGLAVTNGNIIVGDGSNFVAESGATARASLGVDAAGTDNSTDVTLANTNYLTISGQEITGGTVPIGSGGTGATTAANARTALGLEIGTDVQAYDAQLADVAGLAVTNGNIIVGDGSNFVAESGATARVSLGIITGVYSWVDESGTSTSTTADISIPGVTASSFVIITKNDGDSSTQIFRRAIPSADTVTIVMNGVPDVDTKFSYFVIIAP